MIRDAIRRMQAEESRVNAWQAAIRKGAEQLDLGEGMPYTRETLEAMTNSAVDAMHSGRPVDPDVLP